MSGAVKEIDILKSAAGFLGRDALHELLPAPFKLTYDSHATGCHAYIGIEADGHVPVTVWEGSMWYSQCYEFNDRNKKFGITQEFARPMVEAYFSRLEELCAEAVRRQENEKINKQVETEVETEAAIEYYKHLVKR